MSKEKWEKAGRAASLTYKFIKFGFKHPIITVLVGYSLFSIGYVYLGPGGDDLSTDTVSSPMETSIPQLTAANISVNNPTVTALVGKTQETQNKASQPKQPRKYLGVASCTTNRATNAVNPNPKVSNYAKGAKVEIFTEEDIYDPNLAHTTLGDTYPRQVFGDCNWMRVIVITP